MQYLKDGQSKSHAEYEKLIAEHRERKARMESVNESFLASFDEEMTSRKLTGDPGSFTQPQYYHMLADLHGAGTDTTLSTLRWFILYMAVYFDEQVDIKNH